MGWNSVDESMPPCGEEVLTWDGVELGIGHTDVEVDFGIEYFTNETSEIPITHWCEIPSTDDL